MIRRRRAFVAVGTTALVLGVAAAVVAAVTVSRADVDVTAVTDPSVAPIAIVTPAPVRTCPASGAAQQRTAALPAIAPRPSGAGVAIRGQVEADGRGLGGVRVGFTDPRVVGSSIATGQTSSDGRFTLTVPGDAQGYVWAGVDAAALHVLFTSGATTYQRGVVGAAQPAGIAGVLLQSLRSASPARIAGGGPVVLRLQRAGSIAGWDPHLIAPGPKDAEGDRPRGRVRVVRGDGSLVRDLGADARGSFGPLVVAPGRYTLRFEPEDGTSYSAKSVTVAAGAALETTAAGATPVTASGAPGGTGAVEGRVTAQGKAPASLKVVALRDGEQIAEAATDAGGRYVLPGLPSGRVQVVVNPNDRTRENPDADGQVGPDRDDRYAPARLTVTVPVGGTVTRDVRMPSGGTVEGQAVPGDIVTLQDSGGRVIRFARTSSSGAFAVRGLPSGRVVVIVERRGAELIGERSAEVRTGATTKVGVVTPDRSITLRGTVPCGSGGFVLTGGDGPFDQLSVTAARDGTYSISVLPGTYTVSTSFDAGRPSPTETIRIGNTAALVAYDPPTGIVPAPRATYRFRFTTLGGVPIRYEPTIVATDGSSTQADRIDLEHAAWAQVSAVPGMYRWGSTLGISPASDGPWWYRSPTDTVELSADPSSPIVVPLAIRS